MRRRFMCRRPGTDDGEDLTRDLFGRSKQTLEWISVKERLPEEYSACYLKYEYLNGYVGNALGYLDNGEWEIEWSDDHAMSKHISHWLDEI